MTTLSASSSNSKPFLEPHEREELGQVIRNAWVRWASRQANPKASHVVPWRDLPELDKEADRCIADELVAYLRLTGMRFRIVEEAADQDDHAGQA